MKNNEILLNGLVKQNPVLRLAIGICSVLALSKSALGALGIGLAVLVVIVLSNIVASSLRKIIPAQIRAYAYILIIAAFTTVIQLAVTYLANDMGGIIKEVNNQMGIFLPLVAVNCIIIGRAESFASENGVLPSVIDGLANGLGFVCAIVVLAVVREFLGAGSIFGQVIWSFKIGFFTSASGAFITLGILMAALAAILNKVESRKEQAEQAAKEA